jgi:hypothetical protein
MLLVIDMTSAVATRRPVRLVLLQARRVDQAGRRVGQALAFKSAAVTGGRARFSVFVSYSLTFLLRRTCSSVLAKPLRTLLQTERGQAR